MGVFELWLRSGANASRSQLRTELVHFRSQLRFEVNILSFLGRICASTNSYGLWIETIAAWKYRAQAVGVTSGSRSHSSVPTLPAFWLRLQAQGSNQWLCPWSARHPPVFSSGTIVGVNLSLHFRITTSISTQFRRKFDNPIPKMTHTSQNSGS